MLDILKKPKKASKKAALYKGDHKEGHMFE